MIPLFWFLLVIFIQANGSEAKKIPEVLHWIHLGAQPLSSEEQSAIRSWQIANPRWTFKIWANVNPLLSRAIFCPIDSKIRDLEMLKRDILQREGGIWVHPDLIGCKPLDFLVDSYEGFVSSDGSSVIGCAPGGFDAPTALLPDEFILPDQVFLSTISPSCTSGVCFWKFQNFPALTRTLREIHEGKAEKEWKVKRLGEKLYEVKGWRNKKSQRLWSANELVNIRALPAPKGSVLGWNAGVLHWGSEPHQAAPTRVSIGYYFHAPHAKKKHRGLLNLDKPLSLQTRMEVILESLRLYGKSLGLKV